MATRSCTCGVRMIDGNLERAHLDDCECSAVPWDPNPRPRDHPKATAKQRAFLETLTRRVGAPSSPEDLTIKEASGEIKRLLSSLRR